MSIDLATAKKLPKAEDTTRTIGFEEALKNVVPIRRGHCPQCLEPMGMKNVQGKSIIKVFTARGTDHWCETCFEKGQEKGICIKYRSLDKKERKEIRKMLKKEGKK